MPLIVHSMGAYASYSFEETDWRQSDHNVHKLVKSLKGEPFKGYADIRGADNRIRRVVPGSSKPAYTLFGLWAAARLTKLQIEEFVLVPVPSSTCTSYSARTTPSNMADSIERAFEAGTAVRNWLRFDEKMPPSHKGGTRSQIFLERSLRVSAKFRPRRIVLVDDVKTTGSHLRACANVLRENGADVPFAIVAASTVWSRHPSPFRVDPEDIEFDPD